jgi:hypothetical protein
VLLCFPQGFTSLMLDGAQCLRHSALNGAESLLHPDRLEAPPDRRTGHPRIRNS